MGKSNDPIRRSTQSFADHRAMIYRYVLGILRDPPVAEDLTQETLLRAHRKLTTLDDPDKLVPWLYRIATNVCHDRFRQASRHRETVSLDTDAEDLSEDSPVRILNDPAPRLDKVMEQTEMSACVQEYLAGLPDSHRAVILLHDSEGLTNPEIATMLGVSLATVKIRLHRARGKLRDALARACAFSTDERGVTVCERKSHKHRD